MVLTLKEMLFFCLLGPSASKPPLFNLSPKFYHHRVFTSLTASCADVRETIASNEGAMHQLNCVLSSTDSINSSIAVVGVLGTFENLSERYDALHPQQQMSCLPFI